MDRSDPISRGAVRSLSMKNRLLMLGVFEEVNKLRERNRRNASDCITESDNFSEDAISID